MSQTPMEKSLEGIISIFHKYSVRQGSHDMLYKGEFAKLLKEQLPNVLQGGMTPEATNDMFKELDQNKDMEVSFEEFLILVGRVLIATMDHQDH